MSSNDPKNENDYDYDLPIAMAFDAECLEEGVYVCTNCRKETYFSAGEVMKACSKKCANSLKPFYHNKKVVLDLMEELQNLRNLEKLRSSKKI